MVLIIEGEQMVRTTCQLVLLVALTLHAGCDFFGRDNDADPKLGEVQWTFDLANPDLVDFTKPVIEGEVVYAVGGGELLCLSLAEGTVRWRTALSGGAISRNLIHSGQALYLVDNQGFVESYSKADGRRLWRTRLDYNVSIRNVLAQTETHLYLGGSRGWVGRIRKQDGQIDQKIYLADLKPEGAEQQAGTVRPTDDGYLYVPTGYFIDGIPGIGGNLLAYDLDTGAYRWGYAAQKRQIPIPGYPGQFFTTDVGVNEGVVYEDLLVISATTSIIGLNRFTGEQQWERFFDDDGFWLGMALDGPVVYVGSVGSRIYALDAETGETVWVSQDLAASVITLMEVQNGRLYFEAGKLYVLDAATGRTLWSGNPPGYESSGRHEVYLSPVAVGEGYMVNVGSFKIYGLAAP